MKRKAKVLRWILWTLLALWVVILVALYIILTPSFLTKTANRYAAEYVDGEVHFSGIKASIFRSFPNLNITVDGFTLVYPHEFYARYDSLIPLGDSLHYAGWEHNRLGAAESVDTLASFDRLDLSVNYMEALKGRLRARHAILGHPRIFLHVYDSTKANWNIRKLPDSDDDTSSFKLPPLSIGKISLEDSPFVVFTSLSDSLAASATLDHLTVKGKKERYDIDLESSLALNTNSTGKMSLPVSIKAQFFPDFQNNTYEVKDLAASVATIDLTGEGKVVINPDSLYIKSDVSIDREKVSDVVDYFGKNFPVIKKLDTDALISLEGHCDGHYVPSEKRLPELSVHLSVPDSRIGWEGIDEKGRFDLDATATVSDGKVSADIPDLCFKINGADITLKGSAEDILEDDPLLKVDSKVHLKLDSLTRFLPEGTDIKAQGNLDGKVKGSFRISQLDIHNFDRIGLRGNLVSDGIRIRAFGDTLSAFLGRTNINLGPYDRTGEKGEEDDIEDGKAHVGISATVDSLSARYGKSTYFRGRGISLAARNSDEIIKGTRGRHPLTGHIDISSIGMMDLDSCFVGIRGSSNSFKLTQTPKGDKTVPYISLSSFNKSVRVRESVNRYSLDGVSLNVSAHPGTAQVRERTRMPSRDSLRFRLPDFLSERDFLKKDINLSMSESVAKYVKDWEISGKLKVNEGQVITPWFPLENRFSALGAGFTNDRIDLSGLSLKAGSSDLAASGSLSGLRRALTSRRGRLTLDLNLNSEVINVDEILLAVNSGRNYIPPTSKEALSGVDDGTYLESVQDNAVADTLYDSPLLVLPSNLNAKVGIQAGTVKYSDLETSFVTTDLEMKERCLQVTNTLAMTNMGEVFLEGFYSTRTKKDLTAGFDLMLSNITAEKVIQLFPAVDSIVPMLKAFKGLLDCEMAATTSIDTLMKVEFPSMNGMIKIDGKHLSLAESADLDKLRKTLRFKDRDSSYIDAMSVRGIVKENQLEVLPFILKVDRYTTALDGIQRFDQQFKYHVAALKSPIPFRFGVNLDGTFSDWKWKLGKAKFKNTDIPLFDDEIDGLRLNLVNSIHNIFDRGIDQAIKRNEESQQAIEDKKAEVSYSAEQTEELSEQEKEKLENYENEE